MSVRDGHWVVRRRFRRLPQHEGLRRYRHLSGAGGLEPDEQRQLERGLVVIRLENRTVLVLVDRRVMRDEMRVNGARTMMAGLVVVVRVHHRRAGDCRRDRHAEHEPEHPTHE